MDAGALAPILVTDSYTHPSVPLPGRFLFHSHLPVPTWAVIPAARATLPTNKLVVGAGPDRRQGYRGACAKLGLTLVCGRIGAVYFSRTIGYSSCTRNFGLSSHVRFPHLEYGDALDVVDIHGKRAIWIATSGHARLFLKWAEQDLDSLRSTEIVG